MTFVDDNMLAASPVRSARSGSKSAGHGQDMDAAGQRSAFENAFADAGKKKQPAISISGKADAQNNAAPDEAALQSGTMAEAEAGQGSPRQGIASEEGFMKSTFESSSNPALRAHGKPIPGQDGEHGAQGGDPAQKFSLKRTDGKTGSQAFADIGDAAADAGKTIDGPLGEKVANLLKGAKTASSNGGGATEPLADELPSNPSGDTTVADVSQLLNLLDAALVPAAASQAAETAPVMSELQALAEKAGKARSAAKDAITGKAGAHEAGDANAVRNATEAGSDQVFRFARADGKGQAVSMNLGADGDKAVIKNDTPSVSAKAEAVTVLEARRYLGLAPSGNAAAVTSQIASNPEWARTLQSGAAALASPGDAAAGKVLNTLKIQMHPIDLGMVTATLRLKDDELQVEIKVETGDAFRQLSDDQSAMVKALRAQGFAVDQVTIVFNASDSSGSGNQQPQSQAGQQGREAAGDGARGQQRNENGAQEQGRERWTGNGGTGDASSGAELNRTGDVYM